LSKEKLTNVTSSLINLSPIVLFVYNRPEHTKRTVESLLRNTLAGKSSLFIFSDGAKNDKDSKNVEEVRNYIRTIKSFDRIEIIEREKNIGLANSVISGVIEVIQSFGKVIVLEDDMISSPYFLKYMNEVLNYFKDDQRIFSVTGYTFPIKIPENYKHPLYLSPRSSSWGWGTWKNRWEKADWEIKDFQSFINNKSRVESFNKGGDDLTRMLKNSISGRVDSWSVKWTYTHFLNYAYCVYPVKSRIKNIGTDKSGVHTSRTNKFDVELEIDDVELSGMNDLQPNQEILLNFRKFFRRNILNSVIQKLTN
jgi:hypothetical protein